MTDAKNPDPHANAEPKPKEKKSLLSKAYDGLGYVRTASDAIDFIGDVEEKVSSGGMDVMDAVTSTVGQRIESRVEGIQKTLNDVLGIGDKVASVLGLKDKCDARLYVAGGHALSVRSFSVTEGLSRLFHVSVSAVSSDPAIDLESIVGKGAALAVINGSAAAVGTRAWAGICTAVEQVRAEEGAAGQSTYAFTIAPELWRAGMRTNLRIFQHLSAPEIAAKLLAEWGIEPILELNEEHPKLEYKVQTEETDLAFFERILQEAGVTYLFRQAQSQGEGRAVSRLVLTDRPHTAPPRGEPLPYLGHGATTALGDHASDAALSKSIRHGKVTVRDHDFLKLPHAPLLTTAKPSEPVPTEEAYEDFRYLPGAGWVEGSPPGSTPVADDQGVARTREEAAKGLAARMLDAERGQRDVVTFSTNAADVAAGTVLRIGQELSGRTHPNPGLSPDVTLLVTHVVFGGNVSEEFRAEVTAVPASRPFRPAATAPKPRIWGLQSALVVGPEGSEIYTDEHGRVRVQFHWDREGKYDKTASCWMRVAQPWAGGGYGFFHVPRVGHEVLVAFFDGDPDRPVLVGAVHNGRNAPPVALPAGSAVSVWRSQSTPSLSKDAQPGYNEISFRDDWGHELLNVQAERDLHTLVKNDEARDIGESRATAIGKVDTHHVGEAYFLTVGSGVTIKVEPSRVTVTTGGATLTLDGGDIALHAAGSITVAAGGGLAISSTGGSVKVDGPKIYLNTSGPTAASPAPGGTAEAPKPGAAHAGPPYRPEGRKPEAAKIPALEDVTVGG